MAGPTKFLRYVSGIVTEVYFTVVGGSSAQAGFPLALDDSGHIDPSVIPVGLGMDAYSGVVTAALTAGQFCYIKSDGTIAAASAASTGNDATGFVTAAVSAGATGTMYRSGKNSALTGLTVSTRYYLDSAVAGGVVSAPPTGTGKRVQYLGTADSATTIDFTYRDSITLA